MTIEKIKCLETPPQADEGVLQEKEERKKDLEISLLEKM